MKWIAKQKRAASGAAHKTVNPPYVAIIRRIVFCMIFKLAGGEQQLCCLRTASPQGIAALAAQGGVATLAERSDETFSVMQPFSADRE